MTRSLWVESVMIEPLSWKRATISWRSYRDGETWPKETQGCCVRWLGRFHWFRRGVSLEFKIPPVAASGHKEPECVVVASRCFS